MEFKKNIFRVKPGFKAMASAVSNNNVVVEHLIVGTKEEPYLYPPCQKINFKCEKKEKPSNDQACIVCLDRLKIVVFIPCWHQITCRECAEQLAECPVCRSAIEKKKTPYRC